MDEVELSLKGELLLRARCLQKSTIPEAASWSMHLMVSSVCRHAVVGCPCAQASFHSSGIVMPSSVTKGE